MEGRPTKNKAKLFEERKRLIVLSVLNGFSQSDVAEIFRIPRNTVHMIVKKSYPHIKEDVLLQNIVR